MRYIPGMNNYEFCAQWAETKGKVLDYGCGAGQVVALMRSKGTDASGCDVFYGGNVERSDGVVSEALQPHIRRMENGLIPYPDASFDAVVSNQVFEHVPDMALALREVARVLKPGGTFLALFPDRGVWREGHCGIPFLHWFPKGSGLRVYYAAALRGLGAGYNKGDFPGVMNWARSFCKWLDDWTYYRTSLEIDGAFAKHFAVVDIEPEWLAKRGLKLPAWLARMVSRKLAGRVHACTLERRYAHSIASASS